MNWAANVEKLNRAKAWAKAQGKEGDEEVIKERYIAIGGLVTKDETPVGEKSEVKNEQVEDVKPVTRRRRTSKK